MRHCNSYRAGAVSGIFLFLFVLTTIMMYAQSARPTVIPPYPTSVKWDPFLDTLQDHTLRWFLDSTPKSSGLTPDRSASWSPSSVAAVGFALTCYPIAYERHLITHAEAVESVYNTLRYLWNLPQNDDSVETAGHKGFFYHFLDIRTGRRAWKCELSSVDTGILMAGVLFCQSYFSGSGAAEQGIRALADSLYYSVDWKWFCDNKDALITAWYPEKGFGNHTWNGYNEAILLYVLAMGSPTHRVPDWYRHAWYKDYRWDSQYGITYLPFGPLFGHQHAACWLDFRGIKDPFMWGRGIDYFENGRRATYAQQAYAIDNPQGFEKYGKDVWGISACDGPADTLMAVDGRMRQFWTYRAREVDPRWIEDDGTVSPAAVAGSIAFAPEITVPTLKSMRRQFGSNIWRQYGFVDAFNPTFRKNGSSEGWFDTDYIAIDQGPIPIMIENLRNGFVWNVMKRNPHVVRGLRWLGFSGGWLDRK
jgi:hypothetical protein